MLSLYTEDVSRVLHAVVEWRRYCQCCSAIVRVNLEREGECRCREHRALESHMPAVVGLFDGVALHAREYIVKYYGIVGRCVALEEGDADIYSLAPYDNLVAGIL